MFEHLVDHDACHLCVIIGVNFGLSGFESGILSLVYPHPRHDFEKIGRPFDVVAVRRRFRASEHVRADNVRVTLDFAYQGFEFAL